MDNQPQQQNPEVLNAEQVQEPEGAAQVQEREGVAEQMEDLVDESGREEGSSERGQFVESMEVSPSSAGL